MSISSHSSSSFKSVGLFPISDPLFSIALTLFVKIVGVGVQQVALRDVVQSAMCIHI